MAYRLLMGETMKSVISKTSKQPELMITSMHAIYVNGPEPEQDQHGEEIPVWSVYTGDEYGDATGDVQWCYSRYAAQLHAQHLAKSTRLPIEDDSSEA